MHRPRSCDSLAILMDKAVANIEQFLSRPITVYMTRTQETIHTANTAFAGAQN